MKFKLFLAGILLSVLPALNSCNGSGGAKRAGGDTEVTELRCRDLDDPEGVDRAVIQLADRIGSRQRRANGLGDRNRFRRKGFEEWKSRRMVVRQTTFRPATDVRPQGADLKPGERYWWRVRIWDGADRPTSWSDPASFSLGPAADQWQAKWITAQGEEGQSAALFPHRFSTRINRVRNRYAP